MKSLQTAAAVAALVIAGAAAAAEKHGGPGDEAASIGEPGKAADATRTVVVEMADTMRFTPAMIDVDQGETVRFIVKNTGRIEHEMVLGTPQELKEHYAMMLKMPGMVHHEDNMVSVAPGKSAEIVWHFTRDRVVDFACLQPGHYAAGMKGQIRVTGAPAAPGGREHGTPPH